MSAFRLLILGNGTAGLSALQGLLPCPPQQIEVIAVYPWSLHPKGSQEYFMPEFNAPFVLAAKKQGIPLLSNMQCSSDLFVQWLVEQDIDGLLVCAWGEILKSPLLDLSLPIVNMHPSLLPHHRGINPYISTICQGETETGVTFHQIVDTGIDTGPIILQERVPILPNDTGGELQIRCEAHAQTMMPQVADWFVNPTPGQPQAPGGSYFAAPTQTDACLDWALAPDDLCRRARAMQPWFSPYTFINAETPVTCQQVVMRPHSGRRLSKGQCIQLSAESLSIQSSQPDIAIDLTHYQLGRDNFWISREDSFMFAQQLMKSALKT